jgi:transposase
MPVSPDTLLRLVRKRALTPAETPRVLGVDDWAKRKGKTYGTILVDLEQQRVVDLLPDRTSESLATWLQAHPGVEVITRDRSTTYADGARQGAPDAIQVADRWHLLKNLVETVEAVLARHQPQLSRPLPPTSPLLDPTQAAVSASARPPTTQVEQVRLRRRAERRARYQQVMSLQAQGLPHSAIADRVGISKRTVNRFLAAGTFPERKRRQTKQPSLLAPNLAYVHQRWAEGCRNGTQLWRELCGQGFRGSLAVVLDYVATLRTSGVPASTLASPLAIAPAPPLVRRYTPRQAAVLFLRPPAALQAEEQQDLMHMCQASAEIATTYQFAQDFAQLIRQRRPEALDPWLVAAQAAPFTEFKRFAAGLRQDKAAVQAALQYPWSNGQTEGQINRLKLIKRQMYGRANFDLLRQRVLAA